MSFKRAEKSNSMDTDDFMIGLLNNPKDLKIVDVGEFKVSDRSKEGYKYFYLTIQDLDTSEKVKLSFNVKVNDDNSVYVGEGAKLYPLLSYVSKINDEAIICFKEDIDEALNGLEFKGKSIRRKFGNKSYFVLVPSRKGDE